LIATRNCDFRAFRDEKAGSAQADAAVASGNESLFACELHDSSSLTTDRYPSPWHRDNPGDGPWSSERLLS
jgi:hypothetical protein